MLTPTQESLALLRACAAHRLPLPDGIRRWRRDGEALSGRAIQLAEATVRDAGDWLALPERERWLAYHWAAAMAVAAIALEIRQRAAPDEDTALRPRAAG
jgi:hypothetical protein